MKNFINGKPVEIYLQDEARGGIAIFWDGDILKMACEIRGPGGGDWEVFDNEYPTIENAVLALSDILRLNVATDFYAE